MASNLASSAAARGLDGTDVTSDGKNKYSVACLYCDTCILKPNSGSHITQPHPLPQQTQRKDQPLEQDQEVRKNMQMLFVFIVCVCAVLLFTGEGG